MTAGQRPNPSGAANLPTGARSDRQSAPRRLGRSGWVGSFGRLVAPVVLIAVVVSVASSGRAAGSPIRARSGSDSALRSAVPDGRATPPAPLGYAAGIDQPISHLASAGGTGYLTIFQEISSAPLSVSVDGAAPVVLTDDEINYGLISSGAHTITATNGSGTVASGSVLVPTGQRLSAVIYLAPGGVPTVTGFGNDRSVPPFGQSQLVFRNAADAPPVAIYLNGTMVAADLADDPSSPESASALVGAGPVTIAVTEAGAPASQVLAVQHSVLAAGDLIDVFVVGTSAGHPSSVGVVTDSIQLGAGYRLYASDGGVFDFGDASYFGSAAGLRLSEPVIGAAPTSDGDGYWMDSSDGGVFSFGDASFFGSAAGLHLNEPIVGVAADPDEAGYWLVASDGGVFSAGNAQFYGSTGGLRLNKPIVGMAATPDGKGYWEVASDGGIFSFGDATFYGSTGQIALNKPIVAMIPTVDGRGYWLVSSDGGVFSFGDAAFYGSAASLPLVQPIVAAVATPDSLGYWLVAADGGVFSFGDADFYGSTGGIHLNEPIVAVSAPGLTLPS
ncbi:MAG: hypothetical protein ABSF33_00640 [Acidimicrobiales bacterium]